jgi:flagellin
MRINHNIAALNTHRQLSSASSAQGKSMEKLSSGLRINSAADDAAGLAISEKMRGQIRGLDMASKNAQDATSLIQTAEGALNETHDILQRMRELSVQSANDTNTQDDRSEIQKEINQLKEEVDRISNSTEFNTKKLLNGDAGNKVVYGTNTNVASATVINDNVKADTYAVAVTTAAERATVNGSGAVLDASVLTSGSVSVNVNGTAISFDTVAGDATATVDNFVSALNNANIGIVAANSSDTVQLRSDDYGASESITITDGGAGSASRLLNLTSTVDVSDTGVDVAGTIDAVAATGKGRTLEAASGDAIGLKVTLTAASASTIAAAGSVTVTKNELTTHIGANKDQTMSINISSMTASDLGINSLDVTSQTGSESAIQSLDSAIQKVSTERSKLGAYQNRLDHTINNLNTSSENLTAAESRIRDVDYALAA